eukprot:TRINITY_DN4804_c0_g1_i3.p1 TRINITY_DN4804_c0_g1~~TRINITY_DN4804_c0_g1_i3.p1  ORF type:complete len:141 (-),score=23.55 TRINITY_DN4804_c0_g1_i3:170-592(-)
MRGLEGVIVDIAWFFFFFSSRRRHTRCREVSWARRCVQETDMTLPCSPCRTEVQGNSVSIAIGTDGDAISTFSPMSPEPQLYLPQYCFTALFGVQEKAVQVDTELLLSPDCSHSHSTPPDPQFCRNWLRGRPEQHRAGAH